MILLQIFVWIVDLKVRERSTEYLKKDIKYRRVTIEAHVWKICCHKRLWQKDWIAFPLGDDTIIPEYWADMSLPYVSLYKTRVQTEGIEIENVWRVVWRGSEILGIESSMAYVALYINIGSEV